jgi:hypothetical protein
MNQNALRRFVTFFLCTTLAIASGCASGGSSQKSQAPQPPHRVLFIGNSYTFYNGGIPNALNKLSDGKLDCTPCVSGGKSLAWHWTQGEALKVLRSDRWDDVVLQDYSLQTLDKRDLFFLFVRRFDEQIKAMGARTLLYQTWPRKDRPDTGPVIYSAYDDAAAETGAKLAPVGRAFDAARKKRPDLELYLEDRSHPTPAGSYLAACVFYAAILDRSPVGLGSYVVDEKGKPVITLKPEDAKFLQRVANEIVRPAAALRGE